jgi:tRNA (guanine-N7-)-methyltransferase
MVKKRLEPMGMENVHLVHGNGRICLEDMIDDKTLERVFIFHPDPWFKKRHQKRRVVNREFLDLLRRKMTSDGKIYVSTDVEELWLAMTEEFDSAGYRMAEQDPFWQNDYAGQWQRISDDSGRVSHQAIFGL